MKRNRMELSKNLLQMKFMQRTKVNAEREQEEQSSSKLVDLEMCRKEGDRYMTTNSFLYCENLRFGRMSFKGMNPEIEKLMESKNPKQYHSTNDDDTAEAEVSNNEMAKAFKKLKTHHHKYK